MAYAQNQQRLVNRFAGFRRESPVEPCDLVDVGVAVRTGETQSDDQKTDGALIAGGYEPLLSTLILAPG